MTLDYYKILKVSRTSGDEEIRQSYRKLAMRWHPDRHPSDDVQAQSVAESKFKQIYEAYAVLSDPDKRKIYDLHGEDGFKYDVFSPTAANADDIFNEFLNGDFNNAKNSSGKCESSSENRSNRSSNSNGNGNSKTRRTRKNSPTGRKAVAIENNLSCSLEDLYKGTKRKMVISRIVPDDSGKPSTVEEVLSVDIKPGWKKGTKITFPEKGNQEPGLLPGDLTFIIDEKPHLTFKRDGNDLLVSQKISLVEALTGKTLNLTTLDGRNLTIEISDVIKPGHEVLISGEGMPISKDPKKKGNLRIKFHVKFPSRLSADQKADIKRVFTRSS